MQKFKLTTLSASCATTVDDPTLVTVRLQELHPDLEVALLQDAIRSGLEGRSDVTRASAPTAAGVQQWLKTVEGLRTFLAERHWNIHEQHNCPFISSPDRSISIVVMTGSNETGKNGFSDPTNQAEKGSVAKGFIQQNSQLELFNRTSFAFAKKEFDKKPKETQVWILLYRYDKILNEVRFELSLPTGFNNKRITAWGIRLILGSISYNPADFTISKDEPNTPATVEVEPKTGMF